MKFDTIVLILIILFSVSFTGAIALSLRGQCNELQQEQDLYCEMVELHMENPRFGWPDYKGVYDEVCK